MIDDGFKDAMSHISDPLIGDEYVTDNDFERYDGLLNKSYDEVGLETAYPKEVRQVAEMEEERGYLADIALNISKGVGLGVLNSIEGLSTVTKGTAGFIADKATSPHLTNFINSLMFIQSPYDRLIENQVKLEGEDEALGQLDPKIAESIQNVPKGDKLPGEFRLPTIEENIGKLKGPLNEIEAKTMLGGVSQGIAQFVTGFLTAGGAVKGISALQKAPRIIQGMTKGAIADFLAFDQHYENLSSMIQKHPELQNPVTEFLANDDSDGKLERRMKNVLEGLITGGVLEATIGGIKAVKKLAPMGFRKDGLPQTISRMGDDLADSLPAKEKAVFMERISRVKNVTRDVLLHIYQSALLSSPSTHMKNIVSNTAVALNAILERGLARGITKLSGRAGVEAGETLAEFNGLLAGIKHGVDDAAKAFKTGQSKYGLSKLEVDPVLTATKVGVSELNPLGKGITGLGKVTGVIGKALNAEDEFFKTMNYTGDLYARATRQVVREGLAGDAAEKRFRDLLSNPPSEMIRGAEEQATIRTFTNDLGSMADKINKLRHDVPAAQFVVPFFRTLANITKFGLERFPATGVLFKSYREALKKGGADAAMANAKIAAGSVYGALAASLYSSGIITGGGPGYTKWDERGQMQVLRATGWQPYSIKVGDKYVAYADLEPLGTVMRLWADVYEAAEYLQSPDEETTVQDLMAHALLATAESLTENTWAINLNRAFSALTSDNETMLQRYLASQTASFVPNIIRRATAITDDKFRIANSFVDQVKRRIPGLSNDLPVFRDIFGREVNQPLKGILGVVSPFKVSSDRTEGFEDHFIEQDFALQQASWSQWFNGVRVNLRDHPHIYSRMLELSGKLRLPEYGNMTMTEYYTSLVDGTGGHADLYSKLTDGPDGGKEKWVKKALSAYRRAARDHILEENPGFALIAKQKKTAKLGKLGNYKEIRKKFRELEDKD